MSDYTYRPRRQSRRWLDGDCPRGVLAIYDNGGEAKRNGTWDRYTVFYTDMLTTPNGEHWIQYLGCSESPFTGFGQHGQMRAHEVADYRSRVSHQACKWSDLPADVQRAVRRDCEGAR